jgi:rod shape-determining protein MreD
VAPDLLVIAVLLVGRRLNGGPAMSLGVLLGLVEDATGIDNLGARAIGLGAAGYAAARSRRLLTGEGFGFTPLFLFGGTWLSHALTWALRQPAGGPPSELVLSLPLEAAWAALAGSLAARALPRRSGAEL